MASDSAHREDHFQKKNCPKRTFPSNFVKLVSKILYLFLAEKNGRLLLLFVVVCCNFVRFWLTFFLKPFLKGKILRSSERGVNSILTTILQFWPTSWRDRIFCLVASDSARREDHFQKKICPKRTFPSNFVKLVSKILYLFLAEKMVVCCLLLLLLLLLFVATLSDFGLLFFLIEALIELRKMLLRKKSFDVRFGNCLTPKVPRFCRFTKMQLT